MSGLKSRMAKLERLVLNQMAELREMVEANIERLEGEIALRNERIRARRAALRLKSERVLRRLLQE